VRRKGRLLDSSVVLKYSYSVCSKLFGLSVCEMACVSLVSVKLSAPVDLQKSRDDSFKYSVWLNAYAKRELAAWYFVNCFLKMKRLSWL
jgi:hypothetical protein